MKQAKLIYDTNRQAINFLLSKRGYQSSFDGLLDCFEDNGDPFLVHVYNEVTSSFDEADGNFWPKFKNIFHKATDIASGVNTFINRDNPDTDKKLDTLEEEKKQPNLIYWGGGALAIIIILIIIYVFKN